MTFQSIFSINKSTDEDFKNLPNYRFKQLEQLRNKAIFNIDGYKILGKDFYNILLSSLPSIKTNNSVFSTQIVDRQDSDDATKLILKCFDDSEVECVYIKKDNTVCLSSQVGCPLGCAFCSTAKLGFKRNLKDFEIIEQFYQLKSIFKDIKKIVFMGMGEAMLNLSAVNSSIKYFVDSEGVSIRSITVSTSGIVKGILELSKAELLPKLTLSLVRANDKRSELMPITKSNSLEELKKALIKYQEKSKRRITFAYLMLSNTNCSKADAQNIKKFGERLIYNVNLIYFNSDGSNELKSASDTEIKNFESYLKNLNIPYSVRHSKGSSIKAGCGQLALKRKNKT